MDWLDRIKALLSLDARLLFVIVATAWVTAWALLLLPQGSAEFLGVSGFRTAHRQWIGLAALTVTLMIPVGCALWVLEQLRSKWRLRRKRAWLHRLTPRERDYLRAYIENHSQTATFYITDGVVHGLVAKGFLYQASDRSYPGGSQFDFNIHCWAYDYLSEHPELLGDEEHVKSA